MVIFIGKDECLRSAKLDLQLVVDGSGSIGKDRFPVMLQVSILTLTLTLAWGKIVLLSFCK